MSLFPTILFGFFLGVKHAFEADHMIAVTTMVTQRRSVTGAAVIGAIWGFGHTMTLLVIGLIVILFQLSIPVKLSLLLELVVAGMLIFLGIRLLFKKQGQLLTHTHGSMTHTHIIESSDPPHSHSRPFAMGVVHGLAGSGALMILVLSTIRSPIASLFYILLFGIGSVGGMTLATTLVSLPLAFTTNKFENAEHVLQHITGILSVVFGLFMAYTILVPLKLLF